jgi:hypothetical protein
MTEVDVILRDGSTVNYNKFQDLMKFFGTTSILEFRAFWRSLTVEEKLYYRTARLT